MINNTQAMSWCKSCGEPDLAEKGKPKTKEYMKNTKKNNMLKCDT